MARRQDDLYIALRREHQELLTAFTHVHMSHEVGEYAGQINSLMSDVQTLDKKSVLARMRDLEKAYVRAKLAIDANPHRRRVQRRKLLSFDHFHARWCESAEVKDILELTFVAIEAALVSEGASNVGLNPLLLETDELIYGGLISEERLLGYTNRVGDFVQARKNCFDLTSYVNKLEVMLLRDSVKL